MHRLTPLLLALGLALLALPAGAATVFVTSNGWHTAVVIARADLPPESIPETADFPKAEWFEFGWGDAEYYPAPRPGMGDALKAAFPGPAVVHLAGLPQHPASVFPSQEHIALHLTDDAFARLVAFVNASFERRGAARAFANATGLYAFSLFYPGTGRFSLFNTCNTWTARGLATAGLPLQVQGTQRAEDVMRQLRALATE